MALFPVLAHEALTALCARTFPERAGQVVKHIQPLPSRQHEMTAFELWWEENGVPRHEGLIARRYVSTLSWWRPDDRGKAQREMTVCRWLHECAFPVPRVYTREFGMHGDIVLFERLPGQALAATGRPLREVVEPYVEPLARLLASLHGQRPPDAVRRVVPQVTLPGALADLMAIAYQIGQGDLREAAERLMAHAYDVQEVGPVLLHGDYHFLNVLLSEGQIVGVVDWEFSALGDPRWDVANAYMQLVDFGAADAADAFLNAYLVHSGRRFEGPPLYNAVAPLQQWAISEWLVQQEAAGEPHGFALAQDLIAQRDVHRRRAEMALRWLAGN